MLSFGQSVSVTVTELKVLNLAATTVNFGTNVTSVNVSITASVSTSYTNTSQGSIAVYYKRNSSTSTTPIIPTNGYDGNFFLATGTTGTKTFKITLSRAEFDTTGGIVYVEYHPYISNLLAYKSSNINVTKLPDPISNNIISGNQTIYEGQSASTISGSTPLGGDGTFIYSWQQKIGNGAWTTISGANGINYSPGIPAVTTSYRRIVSSAAFTITGTSNEVTATVLTLSAIQNNTITISGSEIQGSIPTGATGSYTYRWLAYILEGEDPVVIDQTTKDCSVPASVYQFMENIGVAQGLIVREVRSGNKISTSNVITVTPSQPIGNNVITLSGNSILGTLPNGGTGTFKYEYNVYNEFPDGEVVDGVTAVGSNQNYTGVVQGYLITKYYRKVYSGNKVSYSNTVSIPLIGSSAKSTVASKQAESADLTVYPNPTSESINFSTNFLTNKEVEILIYSETLGNEKSVFKGTVTPSQVVNWKIPASYQKGLYFYRILSGGTEVKTGKIIYQ